jgi:hypothetical protein
MHEHMTIRQVKDGDARNQSLYEQKQRPDNVIAKRGITVVPDPPQANK